MKTPSLFLLCILLIAAGCNSVLPQKRTESVRAAEEISTQQGMTLEKIVRSDPVSTLPKDTHYQVQTRVSTTSSTDAGAKEKSFGSVSISMAASILLGSIAVVLLLGAWVAFSRLSAVGKVADEGIGQTIRGLRSVASTVTDSTAKSLVQSLIADAESIRGKLGKKIK